MNRTKMRLYPEVAVGGYSRSDMTVEFYTRVRALLTDESRVLDFGAGRGQFMDDEPWFRRSLQDLRGSGRHVVGIDIDEAVSENPSLDEAHVLEPNAPWPIADQSIDLVLSDWTFEHIDRPKHIADEAARVVKPGGWFCARTPNRRGYVAAAARLVPNSMHARTLRRLQPSRQARDVFPTRYLLNTPGDVARAFRDFDVYHYPGFGEPAYFGSSVAAWRAVQTLHRALPPQLAPALMFFMRRRQDATAD